jgi:hypothetical protein
MTTIFASRKAIEALAALEQRNGGMRLVEVAWALAAPVSKHASRPGCLGR